MSSRQHESTSTSSENNASKDCGFRPVQFLRCCYTWAIKNFSLYEKKGGEYLMSPLFSDEESNEVKWRLCLYPNSFTKNDKGFIFLDLKLCASKTEPVFAKCEILLFNSKLKGSQKYESVVSEFGLNDSRTVLKFVERKILSISKDGIFPDDELIIFVLISAAVCANNVCNPEKRFEEKGEARLSRALTSLLKNKKYSDVTLNVHGLEFHAHKVILASISSVFLKMFKDEKFKNPVDIEDFNSETICAMLHFMYTDKIPQLNVSLSKELMAASEKYKICRLKSNCEDYLSSNLTADTVANFLCLANTYEAEHLKKSCLDFICDHADEKWNSDSWESLANTEPQVLLDAFKIVACM